MYLHGNVPEDGVNFYVNAFGYKFTVLSIKDRVITKVKVERIQ